MRKLIITCGLFLLASLAVRAGVPGWSVNPYAFQYSMTATGVMVIDQIESTDTNDMVGAFVGTDCRGVVRPIYVSAIGRYIAFLMIYSNAATGENITFKMYDASQDTVIDAVQVVPFVPNNTLGLLTNPFIWSNNALSQQADILTYSIPQQMSPPVIDGIAHTIDLSVPYGTNITALIASFTLSVGAVAKVNGVQQASGVTANNFSNPVVYHVLAQDTSATQDWTVTVNIIGSPSHETDILSYSFPEQTGPAVIDTTNHIVNIQVATGTNLNGLIATFTLSPGATARVNGNIQQSGATSNNFTYPVIYEIKAQDSTTQNWQVMVSHGSGVNETLIQNSISVFPNPTHGLLNVDCNIFTNMQVYDNAGRIVYSGTVNPAVNSFDLSSLDNGTYVLKIAACHKQKSVIIIIHK